MKAVILRIMGIVLLVCCTESLASTNDTAPNQYVCFRCVKLTTGSVRHYDQPKEVTTCDFNRVFDLEQTQNYRCDRIQ